jgi:hypothetical protein
MPLHLAFSAGHFVDKAGNIGGFAALVGLAVLALLYFAHARELKQLREWAAQDPERMQELEQRMNARIGAVRRTAPQQVSQGAARPATPAGARVTALPFAPVGVGAPALASATHFPGLVRPPVAPVPAPAPAAVPAAAPAVAARAAAGATATTTAAPPVPAVSNGHSDGPPTGVVPPPPARRVPPPAGAPPRRSVQIRGQGAPSAPARGAAPPSRVARRKMVDPHGRRWAILTGGGVVVIIVLAILLLTGALGGGSSSPSSSASNKSSKSGATAPAAGTKPKRKHTAFVRGDTTVSVINGTFATGLAQKTEDQLTGAGFGKGTAATAADQAHSATVIWYQPGHKRDAQEVKKVLGQGAMVAIGGANSANSVCALKPGTPASNPCQSNVVVVVGSDRTQ